METVGGRGSVCRHAAGGTGGEVGSTKAGSIARKSTIHRENRGHGHKLAATTRHRMETIGGRGSACRHAASHNLKELVSASIPLALRRVDNPVEPSK